MASSSSHADDDHPSHDGVGIVPEPLLQKDAEAGLPSNASRAVPIALTFTAALGALGFGFHVGFSSPNEKAIIATVDITQSEADLMFSLLNVGAMIGCLTASSISSNFGPRKALLFNSLPYVAASTIFSFWPTYAGLCIGRLFAGVAVGFSSVLVPLYTAEISPAHLRGALGCVNQLMICTGITLANVMGLPTVNNQNWWKTQMMLYLIPIAVLVLVFLFYAPETPTYLVSVGQYEEARASLRRLRGSEYNVDIELELLRSAKSGGGGGSSNSSGGKLGGVAADDMPTGGSASGSSISQMFAALTEKKALRPLLVGIGLVLMQQWSGINAFMFHTGELFAEKNATVITTKAINGAIAVNAVQIVFTTVAVLTMSLRGRRFFLLLSSIGMSVSCFVMGYVYYADASTDWKITLVCFYLAFFAMGVGPVVWLVASEIFPSSIRATAMGIVVVINWGSSFAVTASFQSMNDALTDAGVFWFYGGVLILGALFVWFKMPETKDKTLEEIETTFAKD